MISFCQEIYLLKKAVSREEWARLIEKISRYNGMFRSWRIVVLNEKNRLRYFVETRRILPATVNGLEAFLIKPAEKMDFSSSRGLSRWTFPKMENNVVDLINECEIKNRGRLSKLTIDFWRAGTERNAARVEFSLENGRKYFAWTVNAAQILAVDFQSNQRYFYQKAPKYLEMKKVLPVLREENADGIFSVDAFPYLTQKYYLNMADFSFDKHSIVVGASGSGKSKFLSLMLKNLEDRNSGEANAADADAKKYRVVVIDPHAALEEEIGGFSKTVDFKTDDDSLDLFINKNEDVVASTELLLDLFKSLLADQFNSRLERVLRHAIYLLLVDESFNFTNLRKLILELEFRNAKIAELSSKLPASVVDFFLNDFNELRTKSYTEAISPIVGFVDEMEMMPVFNGTANPKSLKTAIDENFLTLFSLDRTKLGDKVTKTIAGLIMQQLLTLVQRREFKEHIIFVIDEVAVVENPILARFLAEARKYNLSLILAGQYFNQIPPELQKAIFANVSNYFVFRVSGLDANVLVDNFNMKIPLDDTRERKVLTLTELKARECIARIEVDGKLLPAFKGTTLDFIGVPRVKNEILKHETMISNFEDKVFEFKFSKINLHEILVETSASRKKVL